MAPLDSQRDTPGPMARSVEDAARLLDVIAGVDPTDSRTLAAQNRIPLTYTAFLDKAGLRGARIGILRQSLRLQEGADPRVATLFETAITDLRRAGAQIVDDFTVPGFEGFPRPPQTPARSKAVACARALHVGGCVRRRMGAVGGRHVPVPRPTERGAAVCSAAAG